MEFFATSKARYSYRGEFTGQPVPREDLVAILQTGVDAPTGCNMQTARFLAVTDPALRAKIAEIVPGKHVATAQAFILVLSEGKANPRGDYHIQDYSAATQSMLLAIADMGYASVWLEGQLLSGSGTQLAQLLNVPKNCTVKVLLPIGVPAQPGPRPDKLSFDELVQFEQF